MLEDIPFSYRAGLLAVLMAVAATLDYFCHGKAATRYKEYAFIWFAGFIGCLISGTNDRITSTISPEYFTLGKGLAGGDGFAARVFLFGLKEGLSAGIIAGAICAYAARRKSKYFPLGLGQLLGLLGRPIVCAIAGALLLPLVAGRSDPAGLGMRFYYTALSLGFDRDFAIGRFDMFLEVWWIHTGLYAGLLTGLVWLVVIVLRRRRAGEGMNTAV